MPLMSNRVMASLMSRAAILPQLARAASAAIQSANAVRPNNLAHQQTSQNRNAPGDGRCILSWRSGVKKRMRHARRFSGPEVILKGATDGWFGCEPHVHPRSKRAA